MSHARILLVEDEPNLRRTLTDLLRSDGYVVESSDDGLKGQELATKNPFDLIILDGIHVDFARSELIKNGKSTVLGERESRLLRYLIERKGTILSRDELLHEVWGYKSIPLTRTVDVHIAWLRQKIEDDPKNPKYIVTVHGQGYRFGR